MLTKSLENLNQRQKRSGKIEETWLKFQEQNLKKLNLGPQFSPICSAKAHFRDIMGGEKQLPGTKF